MALNLVRNSKVFFTTNVDSVTGGLSYAGYGSKNTFELQVLDGFSFSQNTDQETVTLSESGSSPVRGQRSFNTGLAPVDFSFSTYIRPKNTGSVITCEESVLWNALLGSKPIADFSKVTLGTGGVGTISGVTYTAATGTVTINGATLPTGSTTTTFAIGDHVVIGGLTTTVGLSSDQINGYGVVSASAAGSISIVLTAFVNTATTITTPTTMTLTKQGVSQVVKIGSGGTGTFSGLSYTFLNGVGTIALTGTPTTLPIFTVGDIVVISGITGAITGSITLQQINQPAVVRTSTTGALTLELLNPPPGASGSTVVATAISLTKSVWAENGTTYSLASTASSDLNKLQVFGMLFLVDNIIYGVENCVLTQASIDFSIDGIATISWTGQGSKLKRMSTSNTASAGVTTTGEFTGSMVYGGFQTKVTDAKYITSRLSTVTLTASNSVLNKLGTTVITKGDSYDVVLTGGNITINNNVTYLTPEILGVVNTPTTYFTATRAISGSMNAYLRTGITNDTGDLLTELLDTSVVNTEIMMSLAVNIGGATAPKVVLDMPATILTIPSVDVQQVVSTAINFTAEGNVPSATTSVFDLTKQNDLTIRYSA